MRLVRFEDESGGFAVDLHPLITVISGLPAHVRERLVHGLAALPRGIDPGGRGSIEVHGVYLDLNRESLELLELNQDLDVILRSSDLPGSETADPTKFEDDTLDASSDALADSEVRDARRVADEHDEVYETAAQSVEACRTQLAEIEDEQADLNRQLGDARVGLDSFAVAGLKIAVEELAELTTPDGGSAEVDDDSVSVGRDGGVGDASSNDEVVPAATAGSFFDVETLAAERARIESRLSELIDESDRLRRAIKALSAVDPGPVREAYEATAGTSGSATVTTRVSTLPTSPPGEKVSAEKVSAEMGAVESGPERVSRTAPTSIPSPEAQALADEWESIEGRLAEMGPPRDRGRERLDALTSHRDDAYDAMKLAERNLRLPELEPSLVDRLESVHDEIFELDGKSSWFGAGKHRRRMESLRSEESTLLEQLGFDTWSSYIMGITSAGSDPSRRRDHENAIRVYEQAEAELAHAANEPSVVEIDPAYADLVRAHEDLGQRIATFLGGRRVDDPVAELRAIRIDAPEGADTTVDESDSAPAPVSETPLDASTESSPASSDQPGEPLEEPAAAALYDALIATGATMPEGELSLRELRSLAAGWLETMDEVPERIAQANDERNAIEDEISLLAVEFEALPDEASVSADQAANLVAEEPVAEEPVDDESAAEESAPEPEETPELIEARARVAEAEARVRTHEEAVRRIAELEGRYEQLVEQSRNVHDCLTEHEPRVAGLLEQRVASRNRLRRAENSRTALDHTRRESRHQNKDESYLGGSAGAEAVEWYVLARLAQQRSVSFVGSVPLVIDDAFANWPVEALGDVFTRLERMGEVVQIVYLTDDPDVGAWARSLGSDRALVLDMRVAS